MITANGYVYGRNWNFGYNSYSAIQLQTDTYEELKEVIANQPLDSFDAGMGYETVLGVQYTDIIETVLEGEWTKTRPLKPIKRGQLKGKLNANRKI